MVQNLFTSGGRDAIDVVDPLTTCSDFPFSAALWCPTRANHSDVFIHDESRQRFPCTLSVSRSGLDGTILLATALFS